MKNKKFNIIRDIVIIISSIAATIGVLIAYAEYKSKNINEKPNISIEEKEKSFFATDNSNTPIETFSTGDNLAPTNYDEKGYVNEAIEQAETAFANNCDYESALKIIKQAQQRFPVDTDLKEKEEYYKLFIPVSIFTITPNPQGSAKLSVYQNEKDTMGNNYEKSLVYDASWDRAMSLTYDIEKKYNLLTGIGAITRNTDVIHSRCIKIYGDGLLLYSKADITYETKPFTISADITGVTDLKIEINGQMMFANIELQRTVK